MSGISKVPAEFTHGDGPSLADFLPDTSSGYTAYAGTALTDSKNNALAEDVVIGALKTVKDCLLYTSPSPRDGLLSRMPSSA